MPVKYNLHLIRRRVGALRAGTLWLIVTKGRRELVRLIISWDFRGNEYQNTEKRKQGQI